MVLKGEWRAKPQTESSCLLEAVVELKINRNKVSFLFMFSLVGCYDIRSIIKIKGLST